VMIMRTRNCGVVLDLPCFNRTFFPVVDHEDHYWVNATAHHPARRKGPLPR
jgi:hypothetical protein